MAFSQDGDDFFIFNGDSSSDDYGVMLAEVNVWQRTGEYEMGGYDYVEYDYNYNFRDPETGNRIAESGGGKRYILDEDNSEVLDAQGVRTFYRIAEPEEDASEEDISAWEEFNPNNDALFDWSDIKYVDYGFDTWEDVANFNNSGDWSREDKEIKYYSEYEQEDGHIDLKYEVRLIVRDGLARLKDPSGETVSTMATDGEAMPLSIYLANNSMVGESFNYFRDQIEEVVGNVSSLNVTVNERMELAHYRANERLDLLCRELV